MPQLECFKNVHAKIFEIVLIIEFVICEIFLIVNLAVNNWYLKYSSSILALEVLLVLFTFFCLIISIILRIFRSNGTVFNNKYNFSHYFSIIMLILVIINILVSVVEDALFYYVYFFIALSPSDEVDFESLEKKMKAFQKIMNKLYKDTRRLSDDEDYYDDEEYYDDYYDDDYYDDGEDFFDDEEDKLQKKIKRLKTLPWVSFNFNAFLQILAAFLIILLIKRIKNKSDYGTSTQNVQRSSIQNHTVNINNSRIKSSEIRKSKIKSKSNRSRHKQGSKRQKYIMISEPESEKEERIKTKRKEKRKKNKK